jgi:hypothetical protein
MKRIKRMEAVNNTTQITMKIPRATRSNGSPDLSSVFSGDETPSSSFSSGCFGW